MNHDDETIRALWEKVVTMQDEEECESAVRELRAAIHEHVEAARTRVANLGFIEKHEKDSRETP